MRSTKERRQDRQEFLYMYRQEFTDIKDKGIRDPAILDFVERYARPLLTYKSSTYYIDIFLTLRRDYLKLFN